MWQHRLTNKNITNRTADCSSCGNVKIVLSGKSWKCIQAKRLRSGDKRRFVYRKKLLNKRPYFCSVCGMSNDDYRFFDVDHVDSDHKNNDENNLQLLCPNCHRTKTINSWDKLRKY